MRKVRSGVFETNSSSVHTITFSREDIKPCNMPIDKNGKIHVPYGEFGRERALYDDQLEKLSYLVSLCYYLSGYDDPSDTYVFKAIEEAVMDYVPNCTGIVIEGDEPYIDHQSIPYDGDIDIINVYDKAAVQNYIFNPYIRLETRSD